MATMNISLPDDLRDFAEQQVAARSYTSTSEFIRELLRNERDQERFRALIVEGLQSGPAVALDDDYFAALRRRIADRTGS